MEAIEKWTADELRSINGYIQYLLCEALKQSRRMRKPKALNNRSNKEQLNPSAF